MQVTPNSALIEALSQLSRSPKPGSPEGGRKSVAAAKGGAPDKPAPSPKPHQPHLGRFVDIKV